MLQGSPPTLSGKAAETRDIVRFMPTLVHMLPSSAAASELITKMIFQHRRQRDNAGLCEEFARTCLAVHCSAQRPTEHANVPRKGFRKKVM
eukprot:4775644-Amphidinium_carterae.1